MSVFLYVGIVLALLILGVRIGMWWGRASARMDTGLAARLFLMDRGRAVNDAADASDDREGSL